MFARAILPSPARSTWSYLKNLVFIAWIFFCFFEIFEGLILIVIGKIEGTIVYSERLSNAEFSLESHAFERICMHRSHKPTRFISAYRDESYIESIWVFLIYSVDKGAISSISGKINGFSSYFDTKSSPKSFISISQSTSGEVLGRKIDDLCGHVSFLMFYFLPPIHFYDILDMTIFEVFHIPKTRIDKRIIFRFESFQRRNIHMIVVIVR